MTTRQKTNRIYKVLASAETRQEKTVKLVELGLSESDVQELFNLYETEDDVLFTMGVEIECYNVDKAKFAELCRANSVELQIESYNHETRNHFKVVHDGSIVGENAIECVTPVLRNMAGFDNLKKVCDALNESGAKVNKTTGLHAHVGLQNVDFETYKNCFINYCYLEPAIDRFMAKSRRENNAYYCKSLNLKSVECIIDAQSKEEIENVFNGDRYYKLNPVSYKRHNTLEFRQHQGTTDYTKIYRWLQVITALVSWSKKHRLDHFVNEINDIPCGIIDKSFKNYYNKRAAALSQGAA
jgi:hypothetical protein